MGVMVITCFKPKPGKDEELVSVVRDHLLILRAEGLATDRPALAMRSTDGTIIEVFEWVSLEAIQQAHSNASVLALWKRYEAVSDFSVYGNLPEASEMFPGFEPIDV